MTAIERTAYPSLTQRLSQKELEDNYTPTLQEIEFVNTQGRGAEPRLTRLVLLKTIQCIGYFPALEIIPEPIVAYLRRQLGLPNARLTYDKQTSLYRHHEAIRDYLDIKPYRDGGREIITQAIHHAAQTLNDPVDLINVALEQLIYNRCELPAYSSLNRIAVNIRAKVNQALYTSIASRLSSQDITVLDQLPQLRDEASQTDFIVLKSVPGKPLLTEMRRLENRLRWLEGLLDTQHLLKDISLARIQNFADEARSLETYDLRDIGQERRHTLLVCLIHQPRSKIVIIWLRYFSSEFGGFTKKRKTSWMRFGNNNVN